MASPAGSFHRKLSCQDYSTISFLINYFMLADMLSTYNENETALSTRNTLKVERSTQKLYSASYTSVSEDHV